MDCSKYSRQARRKVGVFIARSNSLAERLRVCWMILARLWAPTVAVEDFGGMLWARCGF